MSEIKVGEYVRLHNGIIVKWGEKQDTRIIGNTYLDCSGEYEWSCLIVKHSFNIIDLIEDEDFVILEYKSPKYRERVKRIFEVSKIGEYIRFENVYCDFDCKVGDKKIIDNICKNVKIKSIVTHEQFQNMEYRLGE